MDKKTINHEINMLYRQLGKQLYDDLKRGRSNQRSYKKLAGKIDERIEMIEVSDIIMEGVVDVEAEEVREPVFNESGIQLYKFCTSCQAGNHPEAKKCIRCNSPI